MTQHRAMIETKPHTIIEKDTTEAKGGNKAKTQHNVKNKTKIVIRQQLILDWQDRAVSYRLAINNLDNSHIQRRSHNSAR